ncbi:Hint domain-containing protein [Paracoccus sediminicola]|uniref:Hint domain-containing protein n=1 Tax=Paracoccus sediminicola TaxID=3017783 RepID=UPI0022F03B86|nr:Hint domain-containing protein [Paracoccus sediminicola]WBU56099.1 Hint domain-containing protein [Paracoccus sediminicola]
MQQLTIQQIYLGKHADLDPKEYGDGDQDGFNENETVPSFKPGVVFDETSMKLVEITQNDTVLDDDPLRLEENDDWDHPTTPVRGDSYTYDAGDGAGEVTSYVDSVFQWEVTIISASGDVYKPTLSFVQLEDGSIFTNSSEYFDDWAIQSIRLDAPGRRDFYGSDVGRSIDNLEIVCYARGTMIASGGSDAPVETLKIGDLVDTVDRGPAPILWIGRRRLEAIELARHPHLRPIRIRAGALGPDLPVQDLLVSPQHRILVRGAIPTRMFGQQEVLVAAKQLLALDGVEICDDSDGVEYFHLLLADHQLVLANGAPAETLFTGVAALEAMTEEQTRELTDLFPEIAGLYPAQAAMRLAPAPVRLIAPGRRARQLAARMKQNHKLPLAC